MESKLKILLNNFFQPARPPQPSPQGARPQFQGPLADEKPFVMCPSAMICIKRELCDFKGFMADKPINYTPELEMLSVPNIVSNYKLFQ